MRCAITLQFVGNESKRWPSLPFQKLAEQAFCGSTVATRLNEYLDHVSVLIDSSPQILPLTVDRDEYFVQKPHVS